MRELKLSTGKTISIRPLTFGEMQELRAKKLEFNDEILEFAKLHKIKMDELKEWPMPDAMAFQKAVSAETFGIEEEIKN